MRGLMVWRQTNMRLWPKRKLATQNEIDDLVEKKIAKQFGNTIAKEVRNKMTREPRAVPLQYRHGDLLLEKVTNVPEGAKEQNDLILAYGEVTGHKHVVNKGKRFLAANGSQYLVVPKGGSSLTHEEHAKIDLSEGVFMVRQQRQYTPQENVAVRD